MLYEEFYRKYLKLKKVKRDINKLEDKKISLMSMVDVTAIAPKETSGSTNTKEDKMMKYCSELEETEINLKKKRILEEEIKKQLTEKEQELRKSDEILDKVYLYQYIEHLKWYQIAKKINYGKTKTYDFINEIEKKLQEIKSAEKNGKI